MAPQHSQERAWMMELLVSGLRCDEDYPLYRRKGGVISQAMALHDSPLADRKCKVCAFPACICTAKLKWILGARGLFSCLFLALQSLVRQLVLRGCSIPVVAADLVWNQGLLPWLQQGNRCAVASMCCYVHECTLCHL